MSITWFWLELWMKMALWSCSLFHFESRVFNLWIKIPDPPLFWVLFTFLADLSIWCQCILREDCSGLFYWCRLVVFVFSLLEKWGCLSPSFSAGSLPRRRCEFSWWVSTQLVRQRSFTSSSWEKLSPPFLPLVSRCIISNYWIYGLANGGIDAFCLQQFDALCLDCIDWTCLFNLTVPCLFASSCSSSQKIWVVIMNCCFIYA